MRFLFVLLLGARLFAAPSFITGFELGTLREGQGHNGGSVQSAIVRTGAYAYHASPVNSNDYIGFQSRSAGGLLRPIFRSSRFYLYVAQLPQAGNVAIVKLAGAGFNPEVDLNSDGTLTLADSTHYSIATSASALAADGLWHRIEFSVGYGLTVRVDGVLWAQGVVASYQAAPGIWIGANFSESFVNATADLYFDDLLVDDGSFEANGYPGDGRAVLLPAPFSAGNDYTTSTYLSAGIAAGASITSTMALCVDQLVGHGKSTGTIGTSSNPLGGSDTFDFGDGQIGAVSTNFGPASNNPAVDKAIGATVTIQQDHAQVEIVVSAGLYVDYR